MAPRGRARCVVLTLLLAGLPGDCAVDSARAPHGVVLIVSDDHGYGSTNAYGAPSTLIRTEHMDRIGADGIRFTRAYTTSSVCSPSRYAIMTGRYMWRSAHKSGAVLQPFDPLSIEVDRPTVASMMRRAGYATAAIGKWHLGLGVGDVGPETIRSKQLSPGPIELGFDYFFGLPSTIHENSSVFVENHTVVGEPLMPQLEVRKKRGRALRPWPWLKHHRGKVWHKAEERLRDDADAMAARLGQRKAWRRKEEKLREEEEAKNVATSARRVSPCPKRAPPSSLLPRRSRAGVGAEPGEWVTDTLVTRALEWLEQVAHRPFFLYFATTAVHSPIAPCVQCGHCGSAAGKYGDFVNELDWAVGRLLEFLEHRKGPSQHGTLALDTLVVFVSDNGGVLGGGGPKKAARAAGLKINGHFRGHKGTYWEGGVRVPMMMRWPRRIQPGHVSDELVSAIDVYATLAEIAGTELGSGEAPDSVSLGQMLLGKVPAESPRRSLVIQSECSAFAVLSREWKLVEGVDTRVQEARDWLNMSVLSMPSTMLHSRCVRRGGGFAQGKFPPTEDVLYALAGTAPAEDANVLTTPGRSNQGLLNDGREGMDVIRKALLRELRTTCACRSAGSMSMTT